MLVTLLMKFKNNHCMHCFVNQPTHSSGNSVLLLPAFHYRLLLPFLFVSKLIDYLSLFSCCVRIIDLCVSKLIDYYNYLLTIYIVKRLIFSAPVATHGHSTSITLLVLNMTSVPQKLLRLPASAVVTDGAPEAMRNTEIVLITFGAW